MSDLIESNEFGWISVSGLISVLDNTNLGKSITKQSFIVFSLWCKRVALAIKEKHFENMVRSKCLYHFWFYNILSVLLVVQCMKNF